ncbi:type VI secretion protein IcmF/TssM N-terminal domain-containing protein [Azotobacter vinelandii]|uniref:type VI secretion protein IcmF/TssM N-terminal domain-containing protein n=1 Tax=Azotobacter vinelandii TaxID=354 RepID=UPI00091C1DDE|nr:type VI secretion protein IcmF/TssM N-terminal domain-containing protein [Azotobacter vinelandii]SFX65832.1 type VI secretion system protein ImpL [Azotobacter vinelandii]
MSLPEIDVAVIVALLLLLAAALLLAWLRSQAGSAVRGFYAAVRQMEHDRAVNDRYQTPWLLMIGDEERCAQLCLDWQLKAAGKPAWFGCWWSDPDGALLVVPDALCMPEEGRPGRSAAWWRVLGLLLRLRSSRPLDALVWVVPVAVLLDGEQAVARGIAARRAFIELLQRLGLSLPVYVLVTGMEEVPGFQELIAALPEEARETPLGWSSPFAPEAAWQSHWSDLALDRLGRALSEAIVELGALSGRLGEALYCLPQRFEDMRGGLHALLDPVFQGNALGEAPRLRGLYFVAGRAAAGGEPGQDLSGLDVPPLRGLFSRQLWQRRILAEQGLARAVPRILRLRQRWQQVAGAAALVFGLFWSGAMLWVWYESSREAEDLARLLQETRNRYVALDDDARHRELSRQNAQAFWTLLERAPRWRFASPAFPTSWLSPLDRRLEASLAGAARERLFQPLRDQLAADLDALGAMHGAGRHSSPEGDSPEQWQNYVLAKGLVERVTRLEQQNRWLAQALGRPLAPLETLAAMGRDALGLQPGAGPLRHEAFYNRLLRTAPAPAMQALDLHANRKIAERFQNLMRQWLTQYFLAEHFVRPAGYLKIHLQKLQAGYGNSLRELEEVGGLIDNLRDLVALINAAWARGNGRDRVPGYEAMLDGARQTTLLGPAVVQAVEQEASRLQKSFRDQWIAQAGSRDNLLVLLGGGSLELQEQVAGLDKSIESLLRHDFAAIALRREGEGEDESRAQPLAIDARALDTALGYYAGYKGYADQELAQIPPPYRAALLGAAARAASLAMWSSLESKGGVPRLGSERSFDVPADKALQLQEAFAELNSGDLAQALLENLNRRALGDVQEALAEVEALPMFHQGYDFALWDGGKGPGLQMFRAQDLQDLKQGLAQQFAVMLEATQASARALEWLRMQRSHLSLADYDKVLRLTALGEEMLKHKAQNPASAPALFQQLVARDFVEMDGGTCPGILQAAYLAQGQDDLSRRGQFLWEEARQRCDLLQQQRAATAWSRLADYFNQYLAERFPFSHDIRAVDVDPERVRHLLRLIDEHLPQAEAGLQLARRSDRQAAQDFLLRLKQASGWLGALLLRDKNGLQGLDAEVRWRTDRADERGADQVIAWLLQAGRQEIAYPGDDPQRLRWTQGEPVRLVLRWAKNGSQRPVNDPLQPSLAVADREAGWEYTGPWALLRLMRTHIAVQRQSYVDYTDFPLTFQLPVYGAYSSDSRAILFMRVSLMTQGGKAPLSIQPLPVRAPRSPFAAPSVPQRW